MLSFSSLSFFPISLVDSQVSIIIFPTWETGYLVICSIENVQFGSALQTIAL